MKAGLVEARAIGMATRSTDARIRGSALSVIDIAVPILSVARMNLIESTRRYIGAYCTF
jgi:hypothetical protein